MRDRSERGLEPGLWYSDPDGFRTEPLWARVERIAGDVERRVRRAQESQARAKELLDRAAALAAAERRGWPLRQPSGKPGVELLLSDGAERSGLLERGEG